MKKRLLPILCSLLAAVLLLPPFLVSAEVQAAPEVASTAAVLYNLESDQFLFEKNADARINPAAFTKLMTALLAYEYRAVNGNESITVTQEMLSSAGGTSMKLQVGEILSFDDLLKGLVVQNANDAALVLASVVGGNITSFVEKMNEKAKQLGMEHTYYSNPTGVDSAVMYSTLYDTMILCNAIYRVNDFMLLSETAQVKINATNVSKERTYTNKNALIPYSYITDYYMEGVRGMVAGYTSGAGYCVATVRKKTNATFFVLVSGGVDRSEMQNQRDISSYREAKSLLEWAEETYSIQQVVPKGKIICENSVRLGAGVDHVILVTGQEVSSLLPTQDDLASQITYNIRTEKQTFNAPIIEGEQYGTLDILYQNELLATIPLVAQTNIGLSRWLVTWDAILGFFSHGPAKVVFILVICAAVLYILILIGTVWLQYVRKNRAKNLAIKEINEQEKQRMKKVRMEEKKEAQARLRRVKIAIREGYRVLSGETETRETAGRTSPRQPVRKAVAMVPEKYRKEHRSTQTRTPLPSSSQRPTQRTNPGNQDRSFNRAEHYRVSTRPTSRPKSTSAPRQNVPPHSKTNHSAQEQYRVQRKIAEQPRQKSNARRWPD